MPKVVLASTQQLQPPTNDQRCPSRSGRTCQVAHDDQQASPAAIRGCKARAYPGTVEMLRHSIQGDARDARCVHEAIEGQSSRRAGLVEYAISREEL